MMKTYKSTLVLHSALGTPLSAATLWGHIAWGIRYSSGERALIDWLHRYETAEPPFVMSDPLPSGYWPKPALPPPHWPTIAPSVKEADRRKRLQQRSWISHDAWQRFCTAVSPESLLDAVEQSDDPPAPLHAAVAHAAINRLTGGTTQPEGGTLFTCDRAYYADPPRFDLWMHSPESTDTILGWLQSGLAGGYGKDAGTGLGHVEIEGVKEAKLPMTVDANAFVLLASAVPQPGVPNRGFFSFGVHCGRVGGNFAIGPLPDGSTGRQKRPIHCLLAGSLLIGNLPAHGYIGRVVGNVHPTVPEIRHYGIAPVLPCCLDPTFLARRLPGLDERIGYPGE